MSSLTRPIHAESERHIGAMWTIKEAIAADETRLVGVAPYWLKHDKDAAAAFPRLFYFRVGVLLHQQSLVSADSTRPLAVPPLKTQGDYSEPSVRLGAAS
jgi:hypothetical protein